MSLLQTPGDGEFEDFTEIEKAILQASDYVCPSRDLRPATLQRAREKVADRRSLKHCRAVLVVMVLMVVIVAPAVDRWGWIQGPAVGPSQSQVHSAALKLAAESGMSSDWALTETFSQWRRSLAIRFDHRQNNLR